MQFILRYVEVSKAATQTDNEFWKDEKPKLVDTFSVRAVNVHFRAKGSRFLGSTSHTQHGQNASGLII